MGTKRYISVILPLKLEWEPCYWTCEDINEGERVRVNFAGKEYVGVVTGVDVEPEIGQEKIREIISVERDMSKVLPEEMELWRKVADYYLCTAGEVFKAAYPSGKVNMEQARAEAKRKVCSRRAKALDAIVSKLERLEERLRKKEVLALKHKEGTKAKEACLKDMERLREDIAIGMKAKEEAERRLKAAEAGISLTPFERECGSISLSDAQKKAYAEILEGFKSAKPVLLHGVTGSGKTEIYINLADKTLRKGRNVLYLVPEIALSRQLEERLRRHFSERLITFHSAESLASRMNAAEMVRNSTEGYVVLCTRSGLFLPHHDLGLVIVDEEHDRSYKQDSPAPRYNGRDTALILNSLHRDCNIILGSATPSLEEIYNTSVGRHILVKLKERFHGSEDSEIQIIDTKAERRKNGMHGCFSRKLIDHIRQTLSRGQQVLILRSRRAWATAMQCAECGDIVKCPNCNVSLSYHKDKGDMVCHFCGYSGRHTGICGKCGGSLVLLGAGTQKIEEEAAALFPEATIARLDSDSQNKTEGTKAIKDFEEGKTDILIGTQIITKGFDFENLSLVAIIAADTLLGIQDFRADEKALQLMEQFRGRCGRRGNKGLLVIQTSQPEHPIYRQMAQKHDLAASSLLIERKDFDFPPYTRIIELTIKDMYEDRAERMSGRLAAVLNKHFPPAGSEGLLKCPPVSEAYSPVVDRIASQHIRKIRICFRKDRMLTANKILLKRLIAAFEKDNRYDGHISIDVDPS